MKSIDILKKINKLNLENLKLTDTPSVLKLATTLANTHLASKIYKIIKELNTSDRADDIIHLLKK